jgi:hypothetical protein
VGLELTRIEEYMQGTEPPDLKTTRLYIILLLITVVFVYGARLVLSDTAPVKIRPPAPIEALKQP